MKTSIFDYMDYRIYIVNLIKNKPKSGWGVRMALSKSMGTPVSHITQVLNGSSHFSMEQAEEVNYFFGHNQEESQFFLLLVQLSRASTERLKKRLATQIGEFLEKRLVLKERLGIKAKLSLEDQTIFYSSWLYGMIHVMLSIERFQTKDAIGKYLDLPITKVTEILDFLVSVGLAIPKHHGRFGIGTSRIHLGNDSPLISKFHTLWRLQAIRSLEGDHSKDLHYSSIVTVSESDSLKIKGALVKTIEEVKAVIKDSKEENVHCFAMDFFKI